MFEFNTANGFCLPAHAVADGLAVKTEKNNNKPKHVFTTDLRQREREREREGEAETETHRAMLFRY